MSALVNGLSGLLAAQRALNVTSQNTANVNTPGYSRQETLLAARAGGYSRFDAGAGVEVVGLRRVTDDYLTANVWHSNAERGFTVQYSDLMAHIEQVFGSGELGITTGLDNFYAALNAATDAPQAMAPRQQVLATAEGLSNRFNLLARNIDTQEQQLHERADAIIASINQRVAEIAALNSAIVDTLSRDGNTAALEDQRDLAVTTLAEFVRVRVDHQRDGSFSVSLAGGQALVLGSSGARLSRDGAGFRLQLGEQSQVLNEGAGGALGALLDYRANELEPLRAQLNALAQDVADGINGLLVSGVDLAGQPGVSLFAYEPEAPARTLRLADGITDTTLAFAATGGGPGDNRNLLALLAQKDDYYADYTGLVGALAVRAGQVAAEAQVSRELYLDATARRDSVSGVNLDEEAMQLMRYVQAYQANAKVVGTAGELFDTLLAMF